MCAPLVFPFCYMFVFLQFSSGREDASFRDEPLQSTRNVSTQLVAALHFHPGDQGSNPHGRTFCFHQFLAHSDQALVLLHVGPSPSPITITLVSQWYSDCALIQQVWGLNPRSPYFLHCFLLFIFCSHTLSRFGPVLLLGFHSAQLSARVLFFYVHRDLSNSCACIFTERWHHIKVLISNYPCIQIKHVIYVK